MTWTTTFNLKPGDRIRRTELHDRWGGSGRGGIAPSRQVPSVFFFTNPVSGLEHGYVDHWDGEVFHYAGEGQRGDQTFAKGNKAILLAAAEKRTLHGFAGTGGVVRYVGPFEMDSARPWYITFGPETGGRRIRQVITFRLRPQADAAYRFLPTINRQLQLGHVYRPLADYLPGMIIPKTEIDPTPERRRISSSERALLHWWLAQRIAEKDLQPLSPGPADPSFDLAYRHGSTVMLCAVDDSSSDAPLVRRLTALVKSLNRQRSQLGRHNVTRVIAVEDAPSDGRIEPALREQGVRLTWEGGPGIPAA